MLGDSPGMVAARSSRSARPSRRASPRPTLTPSGANTELHEWAKLLAEGAAAELAVGVLELDSVDQRVALDRELCRRLDQAASSSAAVVVTILNVEPGRLGRGERDPGQRADLAGASGRAPPTPPSRPASADHGGLLQPRCRSSCVPPAGARPCACEHAPAGRAARRPGRPRRRSSKARSSPDWPTGVSRGKPRAYRRVRSSAVSSRLQLPGDRVGDRPERRGAASAGPSARTLPSRESRIARARGHLPARESARRGAGRERPVAAPSRRARPDTARAARPPERAEDPRLDHHRDSHPIAVALAARVAASSAVCVAVAAARW